MFCPRFSSIFFRFFPGVSAFLGYSWSAAPEAPRTWLCGQLSPSMYRKLGVTIVELYQDRGSWTGASSVIHFHDSRQFLIFLWLFLVFLFLSHLRYLRTLVRISFHAHTRAHIISCARSCAYHFISMTPRIQHNFTRPWWLASRRIRHIGTLVTMGVP